ncbi:MAG: hypothetical protein NPIRA02_40260 [Nitrospirales bacterium]|nr:MAG: hypothetical protein NPIRA02_40260 [Nitrospirales bacterium]
MDAYTMIGQSFTRSANFNRQAIDVEARTVELSFSSETEEVVRFTCREVLSHQAGAVDLSRLDQGGPVLLNHDVQRLVGVIESAKIGHDRKGRARIRFSRSALGEETFQDVKDGILHQVSVSYTIDKVEHIDRADAVPTFLVTRWTPLEISLVSIPADTSVGVGRSQPLPQTKEYPTMNQDQLTAEEQREDDEFFGRNQNAWGEGQKERHRIQNILAIGKRLLNSEHGRQIMDKAIQDGTSLNQFNKRVLAEMGNPEPLSLSHPQPLGLYGRDLERYSLLRAVRALDTGNWQGAEFESECSRELQKTMGRNSDGVFMPAEVFQRIFEKGSSATGAALVGTQHMPERFIDLLRPQSLVLKLGATTLTQLSQDVSIPKQLSGSNYAWIAENAEASESTPNSGTLSLSPQTISGWARVTRKMLLQGSPDVELLLTRDLLASLGTGVDVASITGTGANNQPRGVLNQTGLAIVPLGTNGGAPTWDHIVQLESSVAIGNADTGALGYLTNAAVRGKLKRTERFSGTNGQPVWPDTPIDDLGFARLNGYRVGASNNVPANLTKGTGSNLSAIIYGNWADLVIGQWGPSVELLVDPYTEGKKGNRLIIAHSDVDMGVRHVESFAAVVDAVTT